jgi:hypothetical protein
MKEPKHTLEKKRASSTNNAEKTGYQQTED